MSKKTNAISKASRPRSYSKKWLSPIKLLIAIPILGALFVWLSPLAFVPVPWPDDSAFYFVAKEFFKWPPRWVMLPQAPFEPSYAIFNFNTMPLYPILLGLGRWLGIDGSFLLKLWPLAAWALSGSLLGYTLVRKKLPWGWALIAVLGLTLDPELRWGAVLVRPESLVGLIGMALVLGITFGFPNRIKNLFGAHPLWDPIAALLALGAYAHFNAVHLLFPIALYAWIELQKPFRWLTRIALRTALYLSPWILVILFKFNLFIHQMGVQWRRLAVPNDWLSTPTKAMSGLFQELGSPEPWPSVLQWAAQGLWILILLALGWGLIAPAVINLWKRLSPERPFVQRSPSLVPAAGWIVGTLWLWTTKPEVWFVYYIHLATWTFVGLFMIQTWRQKSFQTLLPVASLAVIILTIFLNVNYTQLSRMRQGTSWRWSTYEDFVACVHQRLESYEKSLAKNNTDGKQAFRVWAPTFPDITIELSRLRPDWQYSRTNDFAEKNGQAIRHGHDAEAVVVTETLGWTEKTISAPWSEHPDVKSIWMDWKGYFLNQLFTAPGWKPNRFLCQRGRWQAFMFLNPESQLETLPSSNLKDANPPSTGSDTE